MNTKENIGIILTGQIRNFFQPDFFESFLQCMKSIKLKYNMYMVLVIGGEYNENDFRFLEDLGQYKLVEYDVHHKPFRLTNSQLRTLLDYEHTLGLYLKGSAEQAPHYNGDVNNFIESYNRQITQIHVGIKILESFQVNIQYIMRSRFDVFYKTPIVPFSNSNPLFPHSKIQEQIHCIKMKMNGIDTIDHLIQKQKQNTIGKFLRLPHIVQEVGFGGAYYINNQIVHKPTMFMYNDYVLIAEKYIFTQLLEYYTVFDDINRFISMANELHINHFFTPEAVLIIFFTLRGIVPCMYLDPDIVNLHKWVR